MNEHEMYPLPSMTDGQIVYDGFMKIRKEEWQSKKGAPFHYENLLLSPISVMVLARDDKMRFILNQEFRIPTRQVLLGCPGGLVDPGEDPLKAALRELKEETGYHAHFTSVLGEAYPAPGITGQKAIYILADRAVKTGQAHLEISELVQPIVLSYDEIVQAVRRGAALDGLLGTALFFYSLYRQ